MASTEKSSFLSVENLNHLGATIEGFLYDTYKIQIKGLISLADFERMLRDVMGRIEGSPAYRGSLIAEKNKQVILSVRNILLEKARGPAMEAVAASVPAAQDVETENHEEVMPAPIDRVATKSEVSEDAFMMKLQELEQKRKMPASVIKQAAEAATTATATAPAAADQVVGATEHVVVAVPPPPRHGTTFVISSWDRNVTENPERAVMRWTTPLPFSNDPTGTSIAGMFLPVSFSTYTPYVYLIIEGASGNKTSCLLAPDTLAGPARARGWHRWSPLQDALSYIRPMSSPWVIQLRSADGALMPLGIDHLYVATIDVDISHRTATLKLASIVPGQTEVVLTEADFQVGDYIWIFTKTDKKKTEVVGVNKDSIVVRYTMPMKAPSISNPVHDWIQGRVLNYHRQWSLVLDLTTSGAKAP